MFKVEHDFLNFVSFPSSLKAYSDEPIRRIATFFATFSVRPGTTLTSKVMAKQEGGLGIKISDRSLVNIDGFDGKTWRHLPNADIVLPSGTFDWSEHKEMAPITIPLDIPVIGVGVGAGMASKEAPITTWFDDLKIYQDDVLIYSNDFSKWDPVIGAGVGASVGGVAGYFLNEPLGPMVSEAVGAVLGGVLGGGIGLLTGLGMIPVPQIPALEAAPEGPGAPARLGKYLITG